MPLLIDKNVIYQIAIGNEKVAEALLKRLASGEKVYIATVAHRELTVLSPGDKATGYKQLLEDMHIRTPPPTDWAKRTDFHVKNIQAGEIPKKRPGTLPQFEHLNLDGNLSQYANKLDPKTGLPRATDAFIAAEADALGAELMTYDVQFRNRAEKLGIKIAPESKLPALQGNPSLEKVATARKLLKADSVRKVLGKLLRPNAAAFAAGFRAGAKFNIRALFSLDNILFEVATYILAVADKTAAEEAIVRLQVRFSKEGFAKGVAAAILEWSVEKVEKNLFFKMTPYRIQDFYDPGALLPRKLLFNLAEATENVGVMTGYKYAMNQSSQWRQGLRIFAAATGARQGWRLTAATDPYYMADKYAWFLRFQTDPIAEGMLKFTPLPQPDAPKPRERVWPGTRG